MPAAGYSGTPLLKKLGLAEGLRVWLVHPPDDYFQWLGTNISAQIVASKELPDWVHVFAKTRLIFEKEMSLLKGVWQKNPRLVIWASWYKKSSGVPTDLTEDGIRGYALSNGLVDVKVCAVSEQWSGLKLVVPLSKR
ncbi:MAG: DUF3052 domain-containing protein [Bacteroidota bacterium]